MCFFLQAAFGITCDEILVSGLSRECLVVHYSSLEAAEEH